MARKAREVSSTGMYAVTVRTNEPVFESEEVRELFNECFERFLGDGAVGLSFSPAGAFMLLKESERGISADMKSVMTSFSRSCNKLMNTTGKIFSGRFGSVPVETPEHEAECRAYIESGTGMPEAPDKAPEKEPGEKSEKAPGKKTARKKAAPKPESAEPEKTAVNETEKEPEKVSEKAPEKEPETAAEPEHGAKRWHDDIPVWML